MAAMRREKQYDMFDVATGACSLEDYLFQRYSENDLSSTFWIDEKDEVDELRPPRPQPDGQPGTEPVVIPIQGPRAPKKSGPSKPPPPPEGLTPDSPPGPTKSEHPIAKAEKKIPAADGRDTLDKGQPQNLPGMESFKQVAKPTATESSDSVQLSETESGTPERPSAPMPPSMEDLLARFHQAAKEYEERSQHDEQPQSSEEDETG